MIVDCIIAQSCRALVKKLAILVLTETKNSSLALALLPFKNQRRQHLRYLATIGFTKMGKKFNFGDLCLMLSTILEESAQKNLGLQGSSNLLKMEIEILKNGKNNGYWFSFLPLLKNYIFMTFGTLFSNCMKAGKNLIADSESLWKYEKSIGSFF